jgi:hypothetical protein
VLGTYGGRYRRDQGGDESEQYVYTFNLVKVGKGGKGLCIDAETVCNVSWLLRCTPSINLTMTLAGIGIRQRLPHRYFIFELRSS